MTASTICWYNRLHATFRYSFLQRFYYRHRATLDTSFGISPPLLSSRSSDERRQPCNNQRTPPPLRTSNSSEILPRYNDMSYVPLIITVSFSGLPLLQKLANVSPIVGQLKRVPFFGISTIIPFFYSVGQISNSHDGMSESSSSAKTARNSSYSARKPLDPAAFFHLNALMTEIVFTF